MLQIAEIFLKNSVKERSKKGKLIKNVNHCTVRIILDERNKVSHRPDQKLITLEKVPRLLLTIATVKSLFFHLLIVTVGMVRGSKRLAVLLEAKEGIIGLYHQLLEYCLYKAYDFDVVHARACDRAARLKEENTFLRQKMWEEGWQFKGYHIIDPFGRCYPYVWGAEDEPVPDDPFFYDKVRFLV